MPGNLWLGKVTKTSFLHGANILMNTVLPAVSESQLSGVSLIAEAVARVVMIAVLNMVEDSVIMCGWSVEWRGQLINTVRSGGYSSSCKFLDPGLRDFVS